MTPERFREIEQVFEIAAEVDEAERETYLQKACGSDAELMAEVQSLLRSLPTAQQRLHAAVASGAELLAHGSVEPGHRIGPYRILGPIAGGGMGSVYRAARDDGQFEKDVAIKVIRDGYALDDAFVQRFRDERQILARMEHPHIARLLDGGVTADHVPYLVMEYVDGQPITSFCKQKDLDTKLQLFRQVCDAVHYAHRNLVVHRDIKPANILVTPEGEARLLDFGVAKALESGRDRTGTGISLMTLDYASPEQIRNDPVTTASDIYSLGLLLYELLSSRRAHQFADTSAAEVLRVVCDSDPPPPGAADDLNNIVMKALRKAPAERYGSAEQLAADVRRYQQGLPVEARPATMRYLASKFVRRNRLAVALVAAVVAALLLGGALTWRQARIAERRFTLVRGLANSVVFEVDPALEQVAGTTPARRIIIDRASAYLDKLSLDSQGDRGLQAELAAAYERLAGVKGNPNLANLGDLQGAVEAYEKAFHIREQLLQAGPANPEQRSLLAANKAALGILQAERGETKRGRELLLQAVAEGKGIELSSASVARRIGVAHVRLGQLTSDRSNRQASFDTHHAGLRILEEAQAKFPTEDFRPEIALAFSSLARAHRQASELAKALPPAEKALALRLAVAADRPGPEAEREAMMAHQVMGDVLGAPGQFSLNRTADARAQYEKSIRLAEGLAAADPKSYRAQRDLMVAINRLGEVIDRQGGKGEALRMFERSLGIVQALEAKDHRPQIRLDLATSLARVGDRYVEQGRKADGVAFNRRAMDIREQVVAADPNNLEAKRHVMLSAAAFGDFLRHEKRFAEAEPLLRKSLTMAEALSKADPSDALSNRYVAVASELVGGALSGQRRFREACPFYERALAVITRVNAAGVAVDSDAEGIAVLRKELAACTASAARTP